MCNSWSIGIWIIGTRKMFLHNCLDTTVQSLTLKFFWSLVCNTFNPYLQGLLRIYCRKPQRPFQGIIASSTVISFEQIYASWKHLTKFSWTLQIFIILSSVFERLSRIFSKHMKRNKSLYLQTQTKHNHKWKQNKKQIIQKYLFAENAKQTGKAIFVISVENIEETLAWPPWTLRYCQAPKSWK